MLRKITSNWPFWGKYKSRRWFAMKARKNGISFNECVNIYSRWYKIRGLKYKPKPKYKKNLTSA